MSRENRVGRDQRPPAARFAEIEAALDARVLAALAAAWKMAAERGLLDRKIEDAIDCALEDYSETNTDGITEAEHIAGRLVETLAAVLA